MQMIRPQVFLRAEIRAAREAGQALARGDFEAAFEAKRRELYNHELYRAAGEAQQKQEKAKALVKEFRQPDETAAKSRDMDLVHAGRAILAQFGLGRAGKTWDSYLSQMKAYDPDGFATIEALVKSATVNAGPVKSITYDQFVELVDTLEAIWALSKARHEIEIDGRRMTLEDARLQLSERLSELQ